MSIPEYTTVLGVDAKHLDQLKLVWPTWQKNKPSAFKKPLIIFYDRSQVTESMITDVIKHPDLTMVSWPYKGVVYEGDPDSKWTNPRRYMMLAGFVHVPADYVKTPYWFKIDTDSIAMGDDDWIDPEWFTNDPAIISHPWGFTRPANQMLELDQWVEDHKEMLLILADKPPLNLAPEPGADRVMHKRIGSWCSFWNTKFTRQASIDAKWSCGEGLLPAPTQDGYLWYVAKRLGLGIVRPNMKKRGWQIWSTMTNVENAAKEAMK